MDGNYLLVFFIVVAIVSFVVWCSKQARRASQCSEARRASDPAAQARSDQASAIGVATGTTGGSVKDAAVVRFALDRAKNDGHQPNARDIGIALGMENEISQNPPD
jgi:hypothetical protein